MALIDSRRRTGTITAGEKDPPQLPNPVRVRDKQRGKLQRTQRHPGRLNQTTAGCLKDGTTAAA